LGKRQRLKKSGRAIGPGNTENRRIMREKAHQQEKKGRGRRPMCEQAGEGPRWLAPKRKDLLSIGGTTP